MPCGPATTYRRSRPEDHYAIKEILSEANLSLPLPSDRERTTQSPIGHVFTAVCQQGNYISGVLQWRNLGEELEILELAVSTKHRRQGHASFMLENFLREAAHTGERQIYLEVRESNLPAIGLYTKFGFSRAGRRPNYYRDPTEAALLMQRAIPSVRQG